jgi:hypothetical protein
MVLLAIVKEVPTLAQLSYYEPKTSQQGSLWAVLKPALLSSYGFTAVLIGACLGPLGASAYMGGQVLFAAGTGILGPLVVLVFTHGMDPGSATDRPTGRQLLFLYGMVALPMFAAVAAAVVAFG